MTLEVAGKEIESKVMDHHGLVAAVCQELKIADKINQRIGSKDPRRVVQPGLAVVAMILNGLGFTNRRLYLTPQFFESKAVKYLLGEGIEAKALDDHALGKALDEIASYGATQLFAEVAFEIANEKGLLGRNAHLDSTSFSLSGQYDQAEEDPNKIGVVHGHSKDHRPDLKQVMLSLTMTGQANLPVWMAPQSGNTSDKKSFNETIEHIRSFQKEIHQPNDFMWVADSALYSAKYLLSHNRYRWISRVPNTISACKKLLEQEKSMLDWVALENGYQYAVQKSSYGGIEQRWLIVFSQQAYEREKKTFDKHLSKQRAALEKACWHLSNQRFNCKEDALATASLLQKKYSYFELNARTQPLVGYVSKGRPKKGAEKQLVGYQLCFDIKANEVNRERKLFSKGRFILATNDLDESRLPDDKILSSYKEQQCVEKGFQFLKDPWFMVDSFFLKKRERIEGLMMVMTLCLLVYNFAQYQLRAALSHQEECIPNQKNKPTNKPTMKWVFQLFEGISIVKFVDPITQKFRHIITNLTDIRKKIIQLLGRFACKIYGIPFEIAGM